MCNIQDLMCTFSEVEKLAESGSSGEAFNLYTKFINEASKCIPVITDDAEKAALRQKLSLSYNNRGFIRYNRVDFDEAVQDYTESLKLDSKLYVSYYNRGLIHYRLGRYSQAIEDMTRALTIKPDFSAAQNCLSQATTDKLTRGNKS